MQQEVQGSNGGKMKNQLTEIPDSVDTDPSELVVVRVVVYSEVTSGANV